MSRLAAVLSFACCLVLVFPVPTTATPFIVQSLSSRYAIILGGYGPGYSELKEVEIVKHDKVCPTAISNVPSDPGRFLGDVSGMAEFVDGDSVLFCRHSSCWKLRMGPNTWKKVGGFQTVRDRAASVAVGDTMVVLGGRDVDGRDVFGLERYDPEQDRWEAKPEWDMLQGRYSFCVVPLNSSALMIIGGYTSDGATASVEVLDTITNRKELLQDLPRPRYGHSCLTMEWAGREGVLVVGGALTGKEVVFYDVGLKSWQPFAPMPYQTDGHKIVLVEGIPTVFSWERIVQYNGKEWVDADMKLSRSRSAFAVATVPGPLVPKCQ